jgi:signal transduction histidine kinase
MPQAGIEATITLTTYYNYVSAWVVALEREYGRDQTGMQAFGVRQQSLDALKRLQGGRLCSDEVSSAFCRGKLTLIAIHRLPVEDFPDLAATANLWLPVQAYYAVHAMGIAVFAALGQQVPKDHRHFRAAFSQTVCRLLPFPFCAICSNGPQPTAFTFTGISTSPDRVAAQSNLANPNYSDGHHFVGKSLSTTREKLLEEAFDKARRERVKPNRSRRNLRLDERQRLAQNLHNTSIADLLYRMRIRANYDDPEMYLAAFADTEGAVAYYKALTRLSDVLAEGLCAIIRRKIGHQAMDRLEARLH